MILFVAVAGLSPEEVLEVIELTPAGLLSPEKAADLINLVTGVQFDSLPETQQLAVEALQAKAQVEFIPIHFQCNSVLRA